MKRRELYREMGDHYIVHGFTGFMALMLKKAPWATLRPGLPIIIGYCIGSIIGFATTGEMDHPMSRLILFFFVFFLAGDLVLLDLWMKWRKGRSLGIVKPAPKWSNWKR